MKKIYASAALALAAATGAQAQVMGSVDITVLADIEENTELNPTTGRGLSWRAALLGDNPFDSIPAAAAVGVANTSAEGLIELDKTFFISPTCEVSSEGVIGYVFTTSANGVEPGSIFGVDGNLIATDSINSLLNIDSFNTPGVTLFSHLLVPRQNLVIGQTYGFYAYARPWPQTSGGSDFTYEDPDMTNNWDYVPVIWGTGSGTGIGEFSTKYDPMAVYPNPAQSTVNFTADVKVASHYHVVRIVDMNGRQVLSERRGAVNAGELNGTVDVTALPAGNYSIQVITNNGVAASKFVKH